MEAPYKVIWDNGECCDGFECDTFEEAEARVWDIYDGWAEAMYYELVNKDFSDEALEDWNRMIFECWVEIYEYDPDTDRYEECWFPPDADFEKVGPFGWNELTTLDGLFEKAKDYEEKRGGNCNV